MRIRLSWGLSWGPWLEGNLHLGSGCKVWGLGWFRVQAFGSRV